MEMSVFVSNTYTSLFHFLSHLEAKFLLRDSQSTTSRPKALNRATTISTANLSFRNSLGSRITAHDRRYSHSPGSDRTEIPAPNLCLESKGIHGEDTAHCQLLSLLLPFLTLILSSAETLETSPAPVQTPTVSFHLPLRVAQSSPHPRLYLTCWSPFILGKPLSAFPMRLRGSGQVTNPFANPTGSHPTWPASVFSVRPPARPGKAIPLLAS